MAEKQSRLAQLEFWLDRAFRIPGTDICFGLDALIGLIPGAGDLATAGISTIFILAAMRQGAPKRLLLKMAWNILVDLVLGAIPVLGDIFDVVNKANTKNLRLLREFRQEQKAAGLSEGH